MSGYPDVLKYFMWPWQVHFMINCKVTAEGVFNTLDHALRPNSFLIGFLEEDIENRLPICLEPEDLHYTDDEFGDVDKIAKDFFNNDPDRNMMYSGPGMQEKMLDSRRKKSLRLALEKILNESPNNKGSICFASDEAIISGYRVYTILELDRNAYESHIYLKKKDPTLRMHIFHSLIETTKDAFLKDRLIAMKLPEAGYSYIYEKKQYSDFLVEAARSFMYTISYNGHNFNGLHGLFNTCNQLSTTRYENAENYGALIIAEKNHPHIQMKVSVEEPFPIRSLRKMIKLLQLCDDEVSVISDSYLVYGVGHILPTYKKETESIYRIKFEGTHCWDVFHSDDCLMQMRYGIPQFKTETINKSKFISDGKRIFNGITDDTINDLYQLASNVVKESGGAQLIISAFAEIEAERLKAHCIKVQTTKLTVELFQSLSTMDGGILIDLEGNIFAAGVILDGIANSKGDSARGSRYNSAIKYYEHCKVDKPCMVIVISDDGMINIIPDLNPQIKHSEISAILNSLQEICNEKDFDRRYFYDAMDWLSSRRFYLTPNECIEANELKNKLEDIDMKLNPSMCRKFDDLTPNPDMDSSFYSAEA